MSNNTNESSVNQPEDLNEVSRNNYQRNQILLRNPTMEDYFRNDEEIRHRGYVDAIKLQGTIRLVAINARGCSPTSDRKINHLRDAVEKYDIDVLLLNEVNTKWNTVNISRMERIIKQINRSSILIENDSGQHHVTNKDYLPGGVTSILFQKCVSMYQKKKVVKGRLGNWSAIALEHNGKRLEIINLYRIPSSSPNGECCSYTQYVLVDKRIKTIAEYRKEILNEIKHHIQENDDITDILIAGDYNQDIRDTAIRKFFSEIGVRDVHSKINNIRMDQMDKTCKSGSKPIDSFAASAGILDYIEGSMLLDYNDIFETDHRGYMVDIALDEYFEMEFSSWDQINKVMLNPSRRSHREKFVVTLENQLNIYQLEDELEQMKITTTHGQMEQYDNIITRILNVATKSVEGMKRNVPFSKEKEKRRATVLYWKMEIRRIKGINVDIQLKEKRRLEAGVELNEIQDLHDAKKELEIAQNQWNDIVKRGKEFREKEILDYHHTELNNEDEDQLKSRKKIISGIKKKLQKTHTFHYITRHIGKGDREGIKRLHTVDEENKIIKTCVNREQIEEEIITYNEQHLKQAHSSIMYQDKIYKRLRENEIRDKILDGRLRRQDCDDDRVYEFLKLLKVPAGQRTRRIKEITEGDWERVVKRSKKRSASSVFSKRTYAVYKCALGVERMTSILVGFYNVLIKNGYYPKR